ERVKRPETAGLDDEAGALRIYPEGERGADGHPAQIRKAWPMRDGAVGFVAAPFEMRGRYRVHSLDAHRPVQSSSGPIDDEHGLRHVWAAVDRFVAELWFGQ